MHIIKFTKNIKKRIIWGTFTIGIGTDQLTVKSCTIIHDPAFKEWKFVKPVSSFNASVKSDPRFKTVRTFEKPRANYGSRTRHSSQLGGI